MSSKKSSKPNNNNTLMRGVLIGAACGAVMGALATTLAGRLVLNSIAKIWDKLNHRQQGLDFRWLLQ